MWRKFARPRIVIAAGATLLVTVTLTLWYLNSGAHRAAVNARASANFGEALRRAGISTQQEPSR